MGSAASRRDHAGLRLRAALVLEASLCPGAGGGCNIFCIDFIYSNSIDLTFEPGEFGIYLRQIGF